MTETATEAAMRTEDTTKQLPLPQRVLRAGFKHINYAMMMERFSCLKIQDAENKRRARKAIKAAWDGEYKLTGFGMSEIYYDRFETKETKTKKGFIIKTHIVTKERVRLKSEYNSGGSFSVRFDSVRCIVSVEEFDSYLKTQVPDRVLETKARAEKLGLKHFYVAYPEMKSIPETDPILLATIGDDLSHRSAENIDFFEIDMWE